MRYLLLVALLAGCAALREESIPPANTCTFKTEECKNCSIRCDSHGPGRHAEEIELGEGAAN